MLNLAEHLQTLELELLTTATRKNVARLSALLAEDFREFGSSGRIFTKADILIALHDEAPAKLSATDFHVTQLADDVALVTYISTRQQPDALPTHSLRSSLWRKQDDIWRMFFHQGTRIPQPAQPTR